MPDFDEDVAHHVLGLLPKLRLVDELLAELAQGRECEKRIRYFSSPEDLRNT